MTDDDFKKQVVEQLTALTARQAEIKDSVDTVNDIVTMGRVMFRFAYWIGQALRWIGGIAGGFYLVWHFVIDHVKGVPK